MLILSGDRDIFQLVTDDVTLLYPVTTGPSKGIQRMDPAAVEKKTKVHLGCIRISLRSPVSKPIICLESPELDQALLLNGFTSTVILKVYLLIARTSKVKKVRLCAKTLRNVRRNRRLNQLVDTLNLDIEFDQMRFIPDLQELERSSMKWNSALFVSGPRIY